MVYPKSGYWFYTEAYYSFCRENDLEKDPPQQVANLRKAYDFLTQNPLVKDLEEEYAVFHEFYQILFSGVEGKENESFIEICSKSKVLDFAKYAFYSDVADTIKALSKRFALGIISDAWPSIFRVYQDANMRQYFDPFIVSSMYGQTKAGSALFKIALSTIAEPASECLFVDDSIGNCLRAKDLGMQVIVLNREAEMTGDAGIAWVRSMKELEMEIAKFA